MDRREIEAEFLCPRLRHSARQATQERCFRVTSFAWSEAAAASRVALHGTDAEALSNGQQFAAHGKNPCLAA